MNIFVWISLIYLVYFIIQFPLCYYYCKTIPEKEWELDFNLNRTFSSTLTHYLFVSSIFSFAIWLWLMLIVFLIGALWAYLT